MPDLPAVADVGVWVGCLQGWRDLPPPSRLPVIPSNAAVCCFHCSPGSPFLRDISPRRFVDLLQGDGLSLKCSTGVTAWSVGGTRSLGRVQERARMPKSCYGQCGKKRGGKKIRALTKPSQGRWFSLSTQTFSTVKCYSCFLKMKTCILRG